MLHLVGLAGSILAVYLPELMHVAGSPPAQQGEVVEAHEGEERVQDLVVHLEPRVSLGLCLAARG
jgi:hypothetical protein